MAEYRKKSFSARKRKIKNPVTEKIPMKTKSSESRKAVNPPEKAKSSYRQSIRRKNMRVIAGKKLKLKKKMLFAVISVLIIFSVVLLSFSLPTGIIEYIENRVALSGNGEGYPHNFSSSGSLISVVKGNKQFTVVTPSDIVGYNNNGKKIFSYQHGFAYPIVKTSAERFVLYNQGGSEFSVYNLNKELFSGKTEKTILSADISDSGVYAIATQSDSYSSQVTVYNKNNKQIYKWMCADYTINNVTLSSDGKRLAVSVINTKSGKFISKLYILKYDAATPVNVIDFENELILSLNNHSSRQFYTVFDNKVIFKNWKNMSTNTYETDKSIFFVKNSSNFTLIVDGLLANKNENHITVCNKKGVIKSEFNFDKEIIDVAIQGKYIYILSDRNIYIYNTKGELLNSAECDFGIKNIIPISRFSVAAFKDKEIRKISIG